MFKTLLPILQVILLGLYNGQRLDHEPSRDVVTYSRSVEVRHSRIFMLDLGTVAVCIGI